jgi:hypothetical protein
MIFHSLQKNAGVSGLRRTLFKPPVAQSFARQCTGSFFRRYPEYRTVTVRNRTGNRSPPSRRPPPGDGRRWRGRQVFTQHATRALQPCNLVTNLDCQRTSVRHRLAGRRTCSRHSRAQCIGRAWGTSSFLVRRSFSNGGSLSALWHTVLLLSKNCDSRQCPALPATVFIGNR